MDCFWKGAEICTGPTNTTLTIVLPSCEIREKGTLRLFPSPRWKFKDMRALPKVNNWNIVLKMKGALKMSDKSSIIVDCLFGMKRGRVSSVKVMVIGGLELPPSQGVAWIATTDDDFGGNVILKSLSKPRIHVQVSGALGISQESDTGDG